MYCNVICVLKKAVLVVLVIWSCSTTAQNIPNGIYKCYTGFDNTIIQFSPHNQFKYENVTCTHETIGEGTYQITGGVLNLIFKTQPKTSGSSFQISRIQSENSTVQIQVQLYQLEDSLPAFNVLVVSKSNTQTGLAGIASDTNGAGVFCVSRTAFPLMVKLSNHLYQEAVKLDSVGDYMLTAFLQENRVTQLSSGYSIKFKIGSVSSKMLVLARQDLEEAFLLFERIKQWKW